MTHFTITNSTNEVVLFDGEAKDAEDALDKMARDAGYADFGDSVWELGLTYWEGRDDLLIYEDLPK